MTKRYRVKIRNIVMGVPVRFIEKYCSKQFEIVGASVDSKNTLCHIQKDYTKLCILRQFFFSVLCAFKSCINICMQIIKSLKMED